MHSFALFPYEPCIRHILLKTETARGMTISFKTGLYFVFEYILLSLGVMGSETRVILYVWKDIKDYILLWIFISVMNFLRTEYRH